MVSNIPDPIFIFFTELAHRIYDDQSDCARKQVIHLLHEWREKNTLSMFTNPSQRQSLEKAIDLAIEITKYAFIPPWKREG